MKTLVWDGKRLVAPVVVCRHQLIDHIAERLAVQHDEPKSTLEKGQQSATCRVAGDDHQDDAADDLPDWLPEVEPMRRIRMAH